MATQIPGDAKNRKIPASQQERTFDQDLSDTMTENVKQLLEHEKQLDQLTEGLDKVRVNQNMLQGQIGEGGGSVDLQRFERIEEHIAAARSDIRGLEEKVDDIPFLGDYPLNSAATGFVFGSETKQPAFKGLVDVRDHFRTTGRFMSGSVRSLTDAQAEIRSDDLPHLRLSRSEGEHVDIEAMPGRTMGLHANTVEMHAEALVPPRPYEGSLGTPQRKFLGIHGAELWIDQLVAQSTRATIGGKIFVGPTSSLTNYLVADPTAESKRASKDNFNYISVKHNSFDYDEVLMLEARGRVEFLRVRSTDVVGEVESSADLETLSWTDAGDGLAYAVGQEQTVWRLTYDPDVNVQAGEQAWRPSDGDGTIQGVWRKLPGAEPIQTVDDGFDDENPFEFSGGKYRYRVERALATERPKTWFEGDGVISTGQKGSGFIELYAQESMRNTEGDDLNMLSGPTIAFSIRDEDASTWEDPEDPNGYYNRWSTRTAVGRLDGHYDYEEGEYTWGIAAGDETKSWIAADDTQGFRLMNQSTLMGQWAPDGHVYIGPQFSGVDAPGSLGKAGPAHPIEMSPQGDMVMYGDLRMPSAGGGFTRPPNWRGMWQSEATYEEADTVSYEGSSYIATSDHTATLSNAPGENDAPWDAFAREGEEGPQGPAGEDGVPGEDAKAVSLTADSLVLQLSKDGTYSPAAVTLTASAENIDSPSWSWQLEDTAFSGAADDTAETRTVAPDDLSGKTATVTVTEADTGLSDAVTVVEVEEGTDSITTVLSNENHTFQAASDGTVETAEYAEGICEITVYEGAEQLTYGTGAGTFSVAVDSTVAVTHDPIAGSGTTATFTPTEMTGARGSATLEITARPADSNKPDVVQTKQITYSKSIAGASTRGLRINAESEVFVEKEDGTYDPASITLTAQSQNLPEEVSYTWTPGGDETASIQGDTFTVNKNTVDAASTIDRVEIELEADGLVDNVGIVVVQEGSDGYTKSLNNSTHTFPATSAGELINTDGAGGTIEMYRGAEKLTYDDSTSPAPGTFRVSATAPDIDNDETPDVTFTTSVNSEGDNTEWAIDPTDMDPTVDTAAVPVTITVVEPDGSEVVFTDTFIYSKSKAGVDAESIRMTASGQVFTVDEFLTGSPGQILITAIRQNISETVSFTTDPADVPLSEEGTGQVGLNFSAVQSALQTYNDNRPDGEPERRSVEVTATAAGLSDSMNFAVLPEGDSAVTAVLSNENHTFQATSDGTVDAIGTGQGSSTIEVYQGAQKLDYAPEGGAGTFSVTKTDTGVTSTLSDVSEEPAQALITPDTFTGGSGTVALTITATRHDGTQQTINRTITYSKSVAGFDAEFVQITHDAQVFSRDQSGSYSPNTIRLTADAKNLSPSSYTWLVNEEEVAETGSFIDISPADVSGGQVEVTLEAQGTTLSDTVVIPVVNDGISALTTAFSNESHTFAAMTDGTIVGADGSVLDDLSGGSCSVTAYEGSTQLEPVDKTEENLASGEFTLSKVEVGITGSFAYDTTADPNTVAYVPSDMTDAQAAVDVTVAAKRADGTVVYDTHQLTYSKSRAGIDAELMRLTIPNRVFKQVDDGTFTPASISAVALTENINEASFSWTINGVPSPEARISADTDTLQLVPEDAGPDGQIVIEATALDEQGTSTGHSDTETVAVVSDGDAGLSVLVTNENHTYPAAPNGDLPGDLSAGNSGFSVYAGAQEIPYREPATGESTTPTPGYRGYNNPAPTTQTDLENLQGEATIDDVSAGANFDIRIPEGATSTEFAVPTSLTPVEGITFEGAAGGDITDQYTTSTISGVGPDNTEYTVYRHVPATPYSESVIRVQLPGPTGASYSAAVEETGISGLLETDASGQLQYKPQSMSADEASVDVTLTVLLPKAGQSRTLTRTLTYSKAYSGQPAKSIRLTADTRVFVEAEDGSRTPAKAVLTAETSNIVDDLSWSAVGGTIDVAPDKQSAELAKDEVPTDGEVTVTVSADGYSDQLTFYVIKDGATGVDGEPGTDAITTVLSNQVHTYQAESDGGIVDDIHTGDCSVLAYEGTSPLNPSLSATVVEGSLGYTINTTVDSEPVFEVDSMGTDKAAVDLTITATRADGSTYTETRRLSYAKSVAGINAQMLRLSPSSQVFKVRSDGTVEGPVTINVQAENLTTGVSWSSPTHTELDVEGATDSNFTLSYDDFSGDTVTVRAEAEDGSLSDEVTLRRLEEGSDAVAVLLTNESHTFQADASGVVSDYTGGATSVVAYEGITQLTPQITDIATSDVNYEAIDQTATTFVPSGMTADEGYVELTISVDRQDGSTETRTKRVTYSKSLAGQNARTISIQADSLVVRKGSDDNFTPSQLTLTANTQNVESPSFSWSVAGRATNPTGSTITVDATEIAAEGSSLPITLTEDSLSGDILEDSVTLIEVAEGKDGLAATISNENHTFLADPEGNIVGGDLTGGITDVQVYLGTDLAAANEDETTPETFYVSDNTGSLTGVDGTITSLDDNTVRFEPTQMQPDEATVELTITVVLENGNTRTLKRSVHYTKSIAGQPARSLRMTADTQVFAKDANGDITPSKANIAVETSNITDDPTWQANNQDGTLVTLGDGGDADPKTVTLSAGDVPEDGKVTVDVSAEGYSDQMTFYVIKDGAMGEDGTDAMTSVLSNEAHTYRAASDGTLMGGSVFSDGDCTVTLYEGTIELTPGSSDAGTFSLTVSPSAGISGSINTAGDTFEVSGMSEDRAHVDLTINATRLDGTAYTETRRVSYAKSVAGIDAKLLQLSASSQVFRIPNDNSDAPDPVTVSVKAENLDGDVVWENSEGVSNPANGASSFTLSYDDFSGETITVSVSTTDENETLTDEITLARLAEGSNAVTALLSNESHTFQADVEGTVSDYSDGATDFLVYEGAVALSLNSLTVKDKTSGITGTVTDNTFTPADMNGVDEGYVDLEATVTRQNGETETRTKRVTYSKSLAGADAKAVRINAEGLAFRKGTDGGHTPDDITLQAVSENIASPDYEWSYGATTTPGSSLMLSPQDVVNAGGSLQVTLTEDSTGEVYEDSVTLIEVAEGTDGLTVLLSNANHTFPADSSGNIIGGTESGACTVSVFSGATTVNPVAGGGANTFEITDVTRNGVTQDTLSVDTFTPADVTSNPGTVELTIEVRGPDGTPQTVTRTITYSLSLQGEEGPEGPAGDNARLLSLEASSQVFAVDAQGDPTPNSITLRGHAENFTGYSWTTDPDVTLNSGANSDERVLTFANFGNNNSVQVTVTQDGGQTGVQDSMTIVRVVDGQDGSEGPPGSDGTDGQDAYTVFLTNESHTFPADNNGNIDSGDWAAGATTVRVYEGATERDPATFSITKAETGIAGSFDVNNENDIATYTPTDSMGSDQATVVFTVTVDGTSFERVVSYSKSLAGADGAPGADNQDFSFLEDGLTDIASDYEGLIMTSERLGYISPDDGTALDGRWRLYLDNEGNMFGSSDSDMSVDAFVFESNVIKDDDTNTGRSFFSVGEVGAARNYLVEGTGNIPTGSSFLGYHDGQLAVAGEVSAQTFSLVAEDTASGRDSEDHWSSGGSFQFGGVSGLSYSGTGAIEAGSDFSVTGDVTTTGKFITGSGTEIGQDVVPGEDGLFLNTDNYWTTDGAGATQFFVGNTNEYIGYDSGGFSLALNDFQLDATAAGGGGVQLSSEDRSFKVFGEDSYTVVAITDELSLGPPDVTSIGSGGTFDNADVNHQSRADNDLYPDDSDARYYTVHMPGVSIEQGEAIEYEVSLTKTSPTLNDSQSVEVFILVSNSNLDSPYIFWSKVESKSDQWISGSSTYTDQIQIMSPIDGYARVGVRMVPSQSTPSDFYSEDITFDEATWQKHTTSTSITAKGIQTRLTPRQGSDVVVVGTGGGGGGGTTIQGGSTSTVWSDTREKPFETLGTQFTVTTGDELQLNTLSYNDVDFANQDLNSNSTPTFDSIDFANHEQSDFTQNGRLFWDASAGLYIRSNNAKDGTEPRLQWSGDNFTAGSNLNVSYGGEDQPTLSVVGNPQFADYIGFGNDSKVIEYDDTTSAGGYGWSGKDAIRMYGDGSIGNLALYVGHLKTTGNSEIDADLAISGTTRALGPLTIENGNQLAIKADSGALQRADSRTVNSDEAKLHWYGKNQNGNNKRMRHAWYTGSGYVDLTAGNSTIQVNGNDVAYEGSSPTFTDLTVEGNISSNTLDVEKDVRIGENATFRGSTVFRDFGSMNGDNTGSGVYTDNYRAYVALIPLTGPDNKVFVDGRISGARSSYANGGYIDVFAENDPWTDGLDITRCKGSVVQHEGRVGGAGARLVQFTYNGQTWVGIEYPGGSSAISQEVRFQGRVFSEDSNVPTFPQVVSFDDLTDLTAFQGSKGERYENIRKSTLRGDREIVGDLTLNNGSNSALLQFNRSANDSISDIFRVSAQGGSGGKLRIDTVAGTTIAEFFGSGATELTGPLTITQNNTGGVLRLARGGGNPSIAPAPGENWMIVDGAGNGLGLNYYDDSQVIIANGGGNVGIGTSNPQDGLDVDKTTQFRKKLGSSGYTSGIFGSGWTIDPNADGGVFAEFDNMRIRNEFRAHIFKKDVVKASNGYLLITDSAEISETRTGDNAISGPTDTIKIDTSEGNASFSSGDLLWLKSINDEGAAISGVKVKVTDVSSSGDESTLTVDVESGGAIYEGDTIVRVSGGYLMNDASTQYAPFLAVYDGVNSWSDFQSPSKEKVRLGNLAGAAQLPSGTQPSGYGLRAENVFLSGHIEAGSGDIGGVDIENDMLTAGSLTSGIFRLTADSNTITSGSFADTPSGVPTLSFQHGNDISSRTFVHMGETYSNGWTGRFGFSLTPEKNADAIFEVSRDISSNSLTAQIAGWNFDHEAISRTISGTDVSLGTSAGLSWTSSVVGLQAGRSISNRVWMGGSFAGAVMGVDSGGNSLVRFGASNYIQGPSGEFKLDFDNGTFDLKEGVISSSVQIGRDSINTTDYPVRDVWKYDGGVVGALNEITPYAYENRRQNGFDTYREFSSSEGYNQESTGVRISMPVTNLLDNPQIDGPSGNSTLTSAITGWDGSSEGNWEREIIPTNQGYNKIRLKAFGSGDQRAEMAQSVTASSTGMYTLSCYVHSLSGTGQRFVVRNNTQDTRTQSVLEPGWNAVTVQADSGDSLRVVFGAGPGWTGGYKDGDGEVVVSRPQLEVRSYRSAWSADGRDGSILLYDDVSWEGSWSYFIDFTPNLQRLEDEDLSNRAAVFQIGSYNDGGWAGIYCWLTNPNTVRVQLRQDSTAVWSKNFTITSAEMKSRMSIAIRHKTNGDCRVLLHTAENTYQTTESYSPDAAAPIRNRLYIGGYEWTWSSSNHTHIFDGIIHEVGIVEDALSDDELTILANSGVSLSATATSIDGAKIQTGSITADSIAADTITANEIAAGSITADEITVGDLDAVAASIGGWDISTDRITNGYTHLYATDGGRIEAGGGANRVGLTGAGGGGDAVALWAGGLFADRNSAPFRVQRDGSVTASDFNLTGDSDDFWDGSAFQFGGSDGIAYENGELTIGSDTRIDANLSADNIMTGTLDTDRLLIDKGLEMTQNGYIRYGDGNNEFYIGSFSFGTGNNSSANMNHGTPEVLTVEPNNSRYSDSKSDLASTGGDVSGYRVSASLNENNVHFETIAGPGHGTFDGIYNNATAYVTLELEFYSDTSGTNLLRSVSDTVSKQVSYVNNSISFNEAPSVEVAAPSGTQSIRVTVTVEGEISNSYGGGDLIIGDAVVKYTDSTTYVEWVGSQDFIGPEGAVWRRSGDEQIRLTSNMGNIELKGSLIATDSDKELTVGARSLVVGENVGNVPIRIISLDDGKATGSNSDLGGIVRFRGLFDDVPSDYQVRQIIDEGEAAIGAVRYSNGNINLLWMEHRQNGDVAKDTGF